MSSLYSGGIERYFWVPPVHVSPPSRAPLSTKCLTILKMPHRAQLPHRVTSAGIALELSLKYYGTKGNGPRTGRRERINGKNEISKIGIIMKRFDTGLEAKCFGRKKGQGEPLAHDPS